MLSWITCGVTLVFHDLWCLRPPRHQRRNFLNAQGPMHVCLSTSTSALSEATRSFFCMGRTNNIYTPWCWAWGVHGSFSGRTQKVNSRAVQMTAKASSSMTPAGSLHETKCLTPWSEARKRLSSFLWKLQKVESMYKVLPIITVLKSYMANWLGFLNTYNHNSWQREINQWEKNLCMSRKNKSMTLRDEAA